MYDDILVPTDGSEGAQAAVEQALKIAENHGATVHALYIIETTNVLGDMDWSPIRDELMRQAEEATQQVSEKAEELDDQSRNTNVVTIEEQKDGAPSEEILNYADEQDIDLIVMGTHGRTGLERTVLGSTTEKVIRKADKPVLTAPINP